MEKYLHTLFFALSLTGLLLLSGCPCCAPPPYEPCKNAVGEGLYIINEGLLAQNAASVDFYDPENNYARCEDIFFSRNGIPLGDVAHSTVQIKDTLFIVVNNSRIVYKIQLPQWYILGALKLNAPASPRQMCYVSPEKAYLTSLYGGDTLFVFSPKDMTLRKKINLLPYQEGIFFANNRIFVACDAFTRLSDSRIAVLDVQTDTLLATLSLPILNPSNILSFHQKLLVSCIGDYNPQGKGAAVVEIDPVSLTTERVFSFSGSIYDMDIAYDNAYILRDSAIAKIHLPSGEIEREYLTRRSLTGNSRDILYSITTDTLANQLYICNARDYITDGECIVLSPTKQVVARLPAGQIPKTVIRVLR